MGWKHKYQPDLFGEIIVDNFAGGGGASTGIELATGRSVDIAINHDPQAIAMHKANHPHTEHYNENVWEIDPREVTKGRPVGLCWLSPDCTHFSKAKGSKPVSKKIRGLAWVAVRWAATVRPRVIMLENVEEFKTWGPLLEDGYPDPKQKGRIFNSFINALKKHGYQVEFKELRACDYGAPTIRKRFFMVARCDGQPIIWPKPTHGDPNSPEVKSGKLKPWRTAAEIIDWSIPTKSIFDREKPLVENTLRRIARGIMKFIVNNPTPFIVNDHAPCLIQTGYGEREGQKPRILDLHKPLGTVVAGGQKHALVTAELSIPIAPTMLVNNTGHPGSKVTDPIRTITTGGHHALVTAFLASYYTETSETEVRGVSLDSPLHTITSGGNRFALVSAFISQQYKSSIGHKTDQPLGAITTVNKANLVTAFLTKYYGSDVGQALDEPLHTVVTKDRFGLVTVHGQDYQIIDIGMRMLEPHELFKAQGFPNEYIIDRDHEGNKYPKSAQVARCGNSVPPPFAEHLVRANLPELCISRDLVASL